jgi:GNAT superfamily N-acetyltransferase
LVAECRISTLPGSAACAAARLLQFIRWSADVANAKIDLVGPGDIPLIADLYNQIYRPTREAEFFKRRFLGRYNPLLLVASLDKLPVGFFLGFELKPDTFFSWLYGVLPEFRRKAIASQLMDAVHTWVGQHGYEVIRFECQNQHRPMLHMSLSREYDIVGLRWDADRGTNLVIFEKRMPE